MSDLRVLTVIESLGRAGAEQALVNLLPTLKARGHTVEVALLWQPDTLVGELEAAGVRVHRLGLNHRWNLVQGVPRLARVVRNGNFDVVHAHLFFSGLYTALTGPVLRGVSRVATFHNLGYDSYPADNLWRKFRKRLDSWLMRHAVDGRLAVSDAVARHYEAHLNLPPVTVLPNGFPADRLRPSAGLDRGDILNAYGLSADDFVVMFCGRIVHEKGHRFFLEALDLLRTRGLAPKALIVGDGPLRNKVADEVRQRQLENHVRMHPAVPHNELMRALQACDLLVMASTHEGFPLTPAEAMMLNKPVVATRVGGLPDLVVDGVSGVLVPPRDPAALADAMAPFLSDRDYRDRLGQAGRRRIEEHFSTEIIADQLIAFYERLLSRRTPVAQVPEEAVNER